MPAAASLTGAEAVPALQTGANVQTTTQAIANLAPAVASVLVENGNASKISGMAPAGALSGNELINVVKTGLSKQTTAQAVANLAPATPIPQSVYCRNFGGIAPNVTPTVEAIGLDTSNGSVWGYNGSTWINFA